MARIYEYSLNYEPPVPLTLVDDVYNSCMKRLNRIPNLAKEIKNYNIWKRTIVNTLAREFDKKVSDLYIAQQKPYDEYDEGEFLASLVPILDLVNHEFLPLDQDDDVPHASFLEIDGKAYACLMA